MKVIHIEEVMGRKKNGHRLSHYCVLMCHHKLDTFNRNYVIVLIVFKLYYVTN